MNNAQNCDIIKILTEIQLAQRIWVLVPNGFRTSVGNFFSELGLGSAKSIEGVVPAS